MTVPRLLVGVSEFGARRELGTVVTLGLGSCVAIILWDDTALTGGMAHILLPSRGVSRRYDDVGRFPDTAVPALLKEMIELGAVRAHIKARLVGGATMFSNLAPPGSLQIGERNVLAARAALRTLGIAVTGEAVGGDYGRSVTLDVATGIVEVASVRRGVETL